LSSIFYIKKDHDKSCISVFQSFCIEVNQPSTDFVDVHQDAHALSEQTAASADLYLMKLQNSSHFIFRSESLSFLHFTSF
jgi:hypothetical protein